MMKTIRYEELADLVEERLEGPCLVGFSVFTTVDGSVENLDWFVTYELDDTAVDCNHAVFFMEVDGEEIESKPTSHRPTWMDVTQIANDILVGLDSEIENTFLDGVEKQSDGRYKLMMS